MSEIIINQNDATLDLEPGGDFVTNQNGGLALISDFGQVRQRIVRELFTNPNMTLSNDVKVSADYIYHQDYGRGLSRRLGENMDKEYRLSLEALIQRTVAADKGILNKKPAIVEIWQRDQRVYVNIVVITTKGRKGIIAFSYKN